MVDVIVPIYNGYEVIIDCVNSVLTHTPKNIYRLILINDKSTDENIEKYLNGLDLLDGQIIIMHNEENLGFVKTVNVGMKQSTNDVLLLNSDTIVTARWLEKIIKCAYSTEEIATVTPFSNAATICSIPIMCEDNQIPEGYSIEEYGSLVEKVSFKEYPQITTGVGFCFYIKRNILNEIGLFDEETFNKGYGEENDFCYRAVEYGYTNVLCDDTFVWHKGTVSFSNERKKVLIAENYQKLVDKYHKQCEDTNIFLRDNPLKDLQENIKLATKILNNRNNILYLLHIDFKPNLSHTSIGGTQIHVQELVQKLRSKNNCFVLSKEPKYLLLTIYMANEEFEYKFYLNTEIRRFEYTNNEYKNILENILRSFEIDAIHVQHTINHTFDIFYLAKKLDIPIFLTVHDFYYICKTVNLLNDDMQYCFEKKNDSMCSTCLKNKLDYNNNILPKWKIEVLKIFEICNEIFIPNISVKEIYLEHLGESFNDKFTIIEHGVPYVEADLKFKTKQELQSNTFKIAFIGGMAPYKGSRIARSLITSNKSDNIEWHIFGILGDNELITLEQKNLYKHGRYDKADIYSLLNSNQIDLVCILSIWPETYCYTLTEALQSGVPVLVTDIGALGDRVSKLDCGWKVKHNAMVDEILENIETIISDKDEYNKILNNVKNLKFKSLEQMAGEYEEKYCEKIVENSNIRFIGSCNYKDIYAAYKFSKREDFQHNTDLYTRLDFLENENQIIKMSFSWKVLEKARVLKIPFRKQIKSVGYKIYMKFSKK